MNLLQKNLAVLNQKDYYDFPEKKPVRCILGIIWVIVIWFFFQVLPSFVFKIFNRDSEFGNIYYIMMAVGNFIAAFVILFFFLRKEKNYYPKVTKKMSVIEYVSGAFFQLTLSGLISAIVDSIKTLTGAIQTSSAVNGMMEACIPVQILTTVISAAIAEEILLRGCIQNRIMARINNVWALVITSLIFGIIHGNVSQLITASVSGFALCFIYAKTRSLWAAIFAHMVNNLMACLQSDFLTTNANEPSYWIFSLGVVIVSAVLAIPFIKGDAAVIEKK